jgi:EmrB/QacA subfamily drug resistance transporter
MHAEALPPPADSRRWHVLAAIGIGTAMSAVDASIINTVLPLLRRDLGTTVAGVQWVATVYLLTVSALLLAVGRAGDLHGLKRMYLGGFAVFGLGSVLCGLAPSARVLVAMRAVQGAGAAMLFANGPAILTRSFPPEQRGRALGAQGTFTYLGLMVGPALGGWLASALGWRSVFFINVPVAIVGIAYAIRTIPHDVPSASRERFDVGGAIAFAAGLLALLIALNQGHAWGWTAPATLGLMAAAVVVLGAFLRLQRRRPDPVLDLSLFRSRVFSAATGSALLNYLSVYCVTFVVPFLLVQGRHLDMARAGIVLTAQPIVMAVVAPFSGALSDRIGSRVLAVGGMLVTSVGALLLAAAAPRAPLTAIAGGLAVVGLGVALFVSPNNSALMGSAPRHRQGIAGGVMATARNLGMCLGIGLSGAVFTTVLQHRGGLESQAALIPAVQACLYVAAGVGVLGSAVSLLVKRPG